MRRTESSNRMLCLDVKQAVSAAFGFALITIPDELNSEAQSGLILSAGSR